MIHETAIIHPSAIITGRGRVDAIGPTIGPYAIVGDDSGPVFIGESARVGNYALIRGDVWIGRRFRLGSYSSVEGVVTIGEDVTIRGHCEIPSCRIGNRVQIYAGTMFYDTPNLLTRELKPPVIEDNVTLACDVRILGGVRVGIGSYVSAGAFVKQDIPPYSYVKRDGSWTPLR